jgi:pre-mRNA-processing factor 19
MLETFTLRKHLDTTRQELSQALYQHDAACRVIARLMKERDEARAALTNLQASGHVIPEPTNAHRTNGESMDVENEASATATHNGLSSEVVAKMNETCASLSTTRKSRKPVPEGPLSRDSIAAVSKLGSSYTPHVSTKGAISAMALSPGNGDFILTGGADKDVLLTERKSGKVCGRMSGHTKKINSLAFHPSTSSSLKFSASSDRAIKIWNVPTIEIEGAAKRYDEVASLEGHTSDISSLSVHPSGM